MAATRSRHRRGKRGGKKHRLRLEERTRRAQLAAELQAKRPDAVKALRARLTKLASPKQAA